MDSLRVLVVSSAECGHPVLAHLVDAGNTLVPVSDLNEASEALAVQRFDAVLLDPTLDAGLLREFSERISADRATPTGLFWIPSFQDAAAPARSTEDSLSNLVFEFSDARSLTDAMTNLARAVGTRSFQGSAQSEQVIDLQELREQVAFDDELLAEIIDLFLGEREDYSAKLQAHLQEGDLRALSRVAHTIKGSLASLHAAGARLCAQELEAAANDGDHELCEALLPEFETHLTAVEEELSTLRHSLSACP